MNVLYLVAELEIKINEAKEEIFKYMGKCVSLPKLVMFVVDVAVVVLLFCIG